MELVREGRAASILVEPEAYEGVKRIAARVAEDVLQVTGSCPEVIYGLGQAAGEPGRSAEEPGQAGRRVILCATPGRSPLLQTLRRKGLVDVSELENRREVYMLRLLKQPLEDVEELLVILGSDKRGTIYGMFALSEYIGVSPLCFWGDTTPVGRRHITIRKDIETVSREPGVKYRGFFINDEWPCFGSWADTHFGGFNGECYEKVFELLLRLKGNYLWPAMWSASFPLDGPGSRNEELADIYGVVMGYSHHEPCLRASEEWDKVRGPESRYGNEWNFYTNEKGLLHYWEDSLKRSGRYENIITIGMRGERDSSMLGPDATVRENVELLKDIIRKQKELIRKHCQDRGETKPLLLALYKEVEDYFYGDSETPGLKDWEELDGVICMLCEDNFGYMRTLPGEDIRNRKGGFGMYYHLDYHGAPVSYEWVDSTPLWAIRDQMGMAWEYGIREAWIVNVGDLKLHEAPLSYFLALAYDYERWGRPEGLREYTKLWAEQSFPASSPAVREKAVTVFNEYIDINHMRRPESLHPGIYHPCHYEETHRMLERASAVESLSCEVMAEMTGDDRDAYYSMVHFPAMASMNLLKLHLFAGKNAHYAGQGRPVANVFADRARECIRRDRELSEEFAAFRGSKWSGMELAKHIGFTGWNEDGWRYPVLMEVEPVDKPRMKVSRRDDGWVCVRNYFGPSVIPVHDFMDEGCERVTLEVSNDGGGCVFFRIRREDGGGLPSWLRVHPLEGKAQLLEEVELICDRALLTTEKEQVRLLIEDGETTVAVDILAGRVDTKGLPGGTFLPQKGVITMGAGHFRRKRDTAKGGFFVLEGYGTYGEGVRVLPVTASFQEKEEQPCLIYRFLIEEAGDYCVELLAAPANPVANGQSVNLLLENGLGQRVRAVLVPEDFRAGDFNDSRWCQGVLDQIRVTKGVLPFGKGVQELYVSALEAGAVLERIRIYPQGTTLKESFLGPGECPRTQEISADRAEKAGPGQSLGTCGSDPMASELRKTLVGR